MSLRKAAVLVLLAALGGLLASCAAPRCRWREGAEQCGGIPVWHGCDCEGTEREPKSSELDPSACNQVESVCDGKIRHVVDYPKRMNVFSSDAGS
ncbi:MAG: hypothetical protein ACYC8T_06265 [Myxococcaceae bacterium]